MNPRLFLQNIVIAGFLCVLFSGGLLANNNEIDGGNNAIEIVEMSFIHDSLHEFSEHTIMNGQFTPVEKSPFNNGVNTGIYWFRMRVRNTSSINQSCVIEVKEPYCNSARLFLGQNDSLTLLGITGNGVFMTDKPIPSRYLTFPVTVSSGEEVYYLKLNLYRFTGFFYSIELVQDYFITEIANISRMCLYYGIAIMIIILNFFYYFSYRDKSCLLYAISVLIISGVLMHLDGVFVYVFGPGWVLSNVEIIAYCLLMFVGGYLFAAHFLDLRSHFIYSKKIELAIMCSVFAVYAVYFIIESAWLYASGLCGMLVLLTYYWSMSLLLVKKSRHAIFFSIAYFLLLISAISFVLPFLSKSFTIIRPDSLKIGGVVEMLILSYAVVYRMKILKQENAEIHKKIQDYVCKLEEAEQNIMKSGNGLETVAVRDFSSIKKQFDLTDREIDVLTHIVEHKTNPQIADLLFVSVHTVKFHTQNIYRKMDIKGRAEIINGIGEVL